ncbi:MAG: hypothetical protein WC644_04355 [Ignavibacteria bacterium]
MEISTYRIVKIPELEHLISKKGGGTWRSLYDVFYYTRLFKYVRKSQYTKIKSHLFKVTFDWKLKELCERGYLFSPSEDVYCSTDLAFPILREAGGYQFPLPEEPKGKGDINELNNTEVLIKIFREKTKEETFLTFLYPNFGYLIPDALLVELDKKEKKYKLTFIEVEAKKPEWEDVIKKKKQNYLNLATDIQFFVKWTEYCELLNLPKPDIHSIKFTVTIFGNLNIDLGKGFNIVRDF